MERTGQNHQTIMTEGTIWRQLISFSIPLLVGNLFQQLYNTVDSIVVGRYISGEALAAVSSSNSMINLIIGLFIGIATGAGVIISQYYGAGDDRKLHWAVHTCMALSIVGGILLIALGVCLSPTILRWIKTPPEVFPESVLYLRIFFCGSVFNIVYNMGAGVLRAAGDSRRPLYYLVVASVINILLDLIFVLVFRMGTAGVGYATITAQAVSSVLVFGALVRTNEPYRLIPSQIKIDKRMMKRILKLGIPSGIQQSIISLSNVIVQSNINGFGAAAMGGFGSYSKIDGFVMLPLQSFCMAATTFTGQNLGAGKTDRVRRGMAQGMIISLLYTAVLSLFLFFQADQILGIFSPDGDIIRYGHITMYLLLPFYAVMAVHQIVMGTLRGAGKAMETMLISVGNMCILRMIYINCLVPFFSSYEAVMWCYPITWLTTATMDCLYYWKAKWLPAERAK